MPDFEELLHFIAETQWVIGFDKAAENEEYADKNPGCI